MGSLLFHRYELVPGDASYRAAASGADCGTAAVEYLYLLVKIPLAALTVPELFQAAQRIAAATYERMDPARETAVIYLLFSLCAGLALQNKPEARLTRHNQQSVGHHDPVWHRLKNAAMRHV